MNNKKAQIVDNIENYLNTYEYCYAFQYKNMTTMPMQEIRNYWNTSKFMIGKNKVLQMGLGKTEEDELKTNSFKLSRHLNGNCGLMFSNENPERVVE
jgi:mRNA turnover protein 4